MNKSRLFPFFLSKWCIPATTLFVVILALSSYAVIYYSSPLFIDLRDASQPRGIIITAGITVIVTPIVMYFVYKTLCVLNQKNIELQHLTQELQESHVYREALFSVISHDFRSPLVNLSSIINATKSGMITPKQLQPLLEDIESKNSTILEMIDPLLLWSEKQISGEFTLWNEKLKVYKLATDALKLYSGDITKKGIKIVNTISPEDIVHADAVSLSLIIRNLLSHAIKLTPATDGIITISSERNDKFVVIQIKDNSEGMTAEELSKFLATFAIHSTSTGTSDETGHCVGLFLCKYFTKKSGGRLDCESTKGEGTSFKIVLPQP